jgi:hypothetical protein
MVLKLVKEGLSLAQDKGSIDQRAVLRARAVLVEGLYAEPSRPEVIVVGLKC